jgi:aerobic carbon-monoxide dehydrogenase medium subunit
MVGVVAARAPDGSPRIAVTGVHASGAFRWREAEQSVTATFTPESLDGVELWRNGLLEDSFADAEYRGHLAGVLTRRAVALAGGPAPGVMVLSHGSRPASSHPPR